MLTRIGQALAADEPADPVDEIRRQNQEMLAQLQELQDRQEALTQLNQELQDTNRGVVALYAELDERADHLRRADELKSKFLSNMSHEFRTPLNSVLALSRLLLARTDGDLTPEQEKQVQFIRKAAESLTELVNDLLDLAKVEAGKTVVTPVEFTAEDLFGALRGMLRPLLVGDAVALIFEDAADVPPLYTDEGKVSQILRNFLSNAIKFTEKGEVRVWGTADPDADTVTFHVRDTGIGIAEAGPRRHFRGVRPGYPSDAVARQGHRIGPAAVEEVGGTAGRQYRGPERPRAGFGLLRDRTAGISRRRGCRSGERRIGRSIPPASRSWSWMTISPTASRYSGCSAAPAISPSSRVRSPPRSVRSSACSRLRFCSTWCWPATKSWRLILGLRQGEATGNIPIVVTSSTGEERKALHLGADAYLRKPIDHPRLLDILDRLTGNRSTTRVLLVDDEEVTRYLVRQLLPRGVYDVREAKTGTEGLAQLLNERPDVVLLDLKMPEMTGFELLDRISGETSLDGVPAIVLTSAILTPDERQRLRRAARIMSKSDLSGSALTGAITDVLGKSPSEAA